MGPSDVVYARLLTLRTALRRFERWSAEQAQAAGLTPMQHQLMLAIRGHADSRGPTIGEAAEYLLLRHHSVGELVNRAATAGLVRRVRDADDNRVIRLELTAEGSKRLDSLTAMHVEELARLDMQLPAPRTAGRRATGAARRAADAGARDGGNAGMTAEAP